MLEVAPADIASAFSLSPAPAATRLILQGRAVIIEAAGRAFGAVLPQRAGTSASIGGRSALWLGPEEWLLLAPPGEMPPLSDQLAGVPHSLVDVSDRQVGFVADGNGSDIVLMAGCPLDLDVRAFPAGACTRTICGKAEIVLWRMSQRAFRIEVARSFAGYLSACLEQAAADWLLTSR
jgi:sarcosine oxidase subunit gamma